MAGSGQRGNITNMRKNNTKPNQVFAWYYCEKLRKTKRFTPRAVDLLELSQGVLDLIIRFQIFP